MSDVSRYDIANCFGGFEWCIIDSVQMGYVVCTFSISCAELHCINDESITSSAWSVPERSSISGCCVFNMHHPNFHCEKMIQEIWRRRR